MGGGEGHLSLGGLFVGVGLNSSGQEEVRLVVGFCGGGGGWFWGGGGGVTGRGMGWVCVYW